LFIDLKLAGKTVMVVGGGAEAFRKTQGFLDSGATIWVISRDFSGEVMRLGEEKKVALLKTDIKDAESFVNSLKPKPDVFLAATDNSKLNLELVSSAKKFGSMVYAVDNPEVSDFILPAIAKLGDVKVAVSTGGRSPAMAHVLRERIEKLITPQDLLEIELQANIRAVLKERIPEAKERCKALYEILNNDNIKQALGKGNLEGAQKLAMKQIEHRKNKT
jgi:precorrin-2 dehydrogenase/sirohydrochlorin ferrochelatase